MHASVRKTFRVLLNSPVPVILTFVNLFISFSGLLWTAGDRFSKCSVQSNVPAAATSLQQAGQTANRYQQVDGFETPDNLVMNRTLGFSKVFVLSLSERTDKRDAIALSSALTGFDVEWAEGSKGDNIPEKALPYGVEKDSLRDASLGCWRGHMNVMQKIVREGIESALILEDDADWDVRLKEQLQNLAKGTQHVFHNSTDAQSPYGTEWDLLWVGHCGEVFPETLEENRGKPQDHPGRQYMERKYTINDDPTVPRQAQLQTWMDLSGVPEHTRFVHITAFPTCTFGYAVSQRGARKLLYGMSVDRLTGPIDNAMALMCRQSVAGVGAEKEKSNQDRGYDLKCLSVTPPLFFHHRPKGSTRGDSDIEASKNETREKGFTQNIVWSSRNNIENILLGYPMQ